MNRFLVEIGKFSNIIFGPGYDSSEYGGGMEKKNYREGIFCE